MEWNITSMIGAVTLTMKQLGFGTDDIDLTVFGTIRIQQRFTPEAVQKAGISWIARIRCSGGWQMTKWEMHCRNWQMILKNEYQTQTISGMKNSCCISNADGKFPEADHRTERCFSL